MKAAIIMAILLSICAMPASGESAGNGVLFHRDVLRCRIEGGAVSGAPPRIHRRPEAAPVLALTPGRTDGVFATEDSLYFGMMAFAPGRDRIAFKITFFGRNGESLTRRVDSEVRGNWRHLSFRLSDWKKSLRESGISRIEIRPEFEGALLLDDLRFTPRELGPELPELPEVTAGTFFPEYTGEREIARCLEDPGYRDKFAEIDRMRRGSPDRKLEDGSPDPEAAAWWDEVRPDGSITGLAPETIREFERETRSHRSDHEGFSRQTAPRLSAMLNAWRKGSVPRTPANRDRLVAALNYYMACELNRRGEGDRWVTIAFWWPRIAATGYLMFLDEMEMVESGRTADPEWVRFNRLAKELASKAFTEPLSSLPGPPLTADSFRRDSAWIGGNFGYRALYRAALVCRNPLMLDTAAEVVKSALSVTSYNTKNDAFWSEGLTADGAGWGHKEQNYLFRYPADGLRALASLPAELKGSLWENDIGEERFRLILEYLKTSLYYSYAPGRYGPTLLISERECMRWNKDAGYFTFRPMETIAARLAEALPDSAGKLRKELDDWWKVVRGEAPEPSGCRYFWNNDDLINRREDYFIGVNMLSKRTLSGESVPLASSKIDFLSDGTTLLMKRPSAYTVAKGFWLPTAIPGITARQFDFEHKGTDWRTYRGMYDLAGGVSDGRFGACGFRYGKAPERKVPDRRFYKIEAWKSYFCFEDELVCLGAGIDDLDPELALPVRTTVDQTEWPEPCEFSTDGGKTVERRTPGAPFTAQGGSLMLVHGGIGYLALVPGPVLVSGENRPERWLEYHVAHNSRQQERPRTADILTIQFDHGAGVSGGVYGYLVHMRTPDFAALRRYRSELPVRILANRPGLQAVRHEKHRTTQAVFFDPSLRLDDGERLWSVDAPAVLMIRELPDGEFELTVSDPLQNPERKKAVLTVDPPFHGRNRFEIPLPGDPYSGRPVTKRFAEKRGDGSPAPAP